MSYTRVNWADGSGGGTPVSAELLNRMDIGVADLFSALAIHRTTPGAHAPMARFAVGSYTGDDAADRKITTGNPSFTPTYIQLASSTYMAFAFPNDYLALFMTKSNLALRLETRPAAVTGGFYVSGISNTNGTSYTWFAMA